ncbi:Bacteriophage protein [Mycobacteroides abscessus]|nr:Bacteriophage protein [Mycobacteroides abscessus]
MCTAAESPADDLRVTYAGRRGDDTHSVATTARMAKWLHRHAANIALQENGAEICDEIEQVYRSITRVVNRPPEPMIIGPCITDPAPDEVLAERGRKGDNSTRCGYALMAPSHSGSIVCPQCDTAHSVADVLARNLSELDDRNATVRELVDVILPRLDEHVPQSTIERWIRRGRVPVRGRDAQGHQMVRIGDVRTVRAERPRNARGLT